MWLQKRSLFAIKQTQRFLLILHHPIGITLPLYIFAHHEGKIITIRGDSTSLWLENRGETSWKHRQRDKAKNRS